MNKKIIPILVFSLVFCIRTTNQCANAEQTIISVPSSEVLPAEQIILKESNRLNPFSSSNSGVITPSVILGLGHGFEFATGVGTTINQDSESVVRGNLAIKKVFFINQSSRLTVGASVSPYLSLKATPDTVLYTHVSQRIRKTKTTLTAGVYAHGPRSMPDRSGALLGFEQVLVSNKLRLAVDWISGDHSYGRMGVGLKYRPIPAISITSAVIIPNRADDPLGFNISVSKFGSLSEFKINKKEEPSCKKPKDL